LAVANRILVIQARYGESEERLEKLDKEEDAGAYQRLQRKLNLVASRAARYNVDSFSQ
jgi:hypothetical protein